MLTQLIQVEEEKQIMITMYNNNNGSSTKNTNNVKESNKLIDLIPTLM